MGHVKKNRRFSYFILDILDNKTGDGASAIDR